MSERHRRHAGYALARAWQLLWGLPQNVLGAAMAALLWRRCAHRRFRMAFVSEWPLDSGLSLGMFLFVPRRCPRSLLVHEYGHTMQSMLLGPAYLPLIVVPSLVWAGLPRLRRYRSVHEYSYYRFFTERWANVLALRVTGERPMGWFDRGK